MNPPVLTRVLFDEAHSQAWTIRPDLAARMQPAHPGDCSMAIAAQTLAGHGVEIRFRGEGLLTREALAGHGVLVLAHPSDERWERTTGVGSPRLSAEELDAVEDFVMDGGGLLVLGETEQEKYGNNLNELLGRFGIVLEHDTVQDYEHNAGAPSWIKAELEEGERGLAGDVLARVREICLYRAGALTAIEGARVVARAHASSSRPGAALFVTGKFGAGRVAAVADSDLFGDDCITDFDHQTLWADLIAWLAPVAEAPGPVAEAAGLVAEAPGPVAEAAGLVAEPAGPMAEAAGLAKEAPGLVSEASAADIRTSFAENPVWLALREATDALGLIQTADGTVPEGREHVRARAYVAAMRAAVTELAPLFPHQVEYLLAVSSDLTRWADGGFGRPDFAVSLELFRPDLHRVDGSTHLVVFPMYKQNGSRETRFEALVVRIPWPEWIADLEASRYDNAKFLPVEFVDATQGYREGECATLFPETVAVAGRPANHFGAIFCDRESARLRRVAGSAVQLLSLNLPPDAARMLRSPGICQTAYILWDLIHDRAHSHGELPFDPFMIRQRAPYWMYSLEELRCDLTAFAEAEVLVKEGLGFARHVQYAILLDRLLRFPITGGRVRNYDGLGGQLLFAHLRREGHLSWADNRLSIDWVSVGEGVASLRARVEELYRAGIDRTKLGHWTAAHDLVAGCVPPAAGSRWSGSVRAFGEPEDPRELVDLVLPDEFPLSIFYSSLKTKLMHDAQPLAV